MNTDIRYIFLDLGGTFRVIDEDPVYLSTARAKIAELCGVETDNPNQWFSDVIDKRYDKYRDWALKFMCEAPEEVLWTRWLAYDMDQERIRKNAAELTYQYRQTKGRRTVVEGGAKTVKELCARLDADGLRPYFKTVQQSSITYIRKPGPAIYYYALEEVGAQPENCCYVGDNLNRDIVGAKAVAFGMTVAVQYNKEKPLKLTEENMPDGKVYTFPQLLDIFPQRGKVAVEKLILPNDGQ